LGLARIAVTILVTGDTQTWYRRWYRATSPTMSPGGPGAVLRRGRSQRSVPVIRAHGSSSGVARSGAVRCALVPTGGRGTASSLSGLPNDRVSAVVGSRRGSGSGATVVGSRTWHGTGSCRGAGVGPGLGRLPSRGPRPPGGWLVGGAGFGAQAMTRAVGTGRDVGVRGGSSGGRQGSWRVRRARWRRRVGDRFTNGTKAPNPDGSQVDQRPWWLGRVVGADTRGRWRPDLAHLAEAASHLVLDASVEVVVQVVLSVEPAGPD
jgi:hypothetical protein